MCVMAVSITLSIPCTSSEMLPSEKPEQNMSSAEIL